jgi:diguanylate cyclase (GGDEF)-like protein
LLFDLDHFKAINDTHGHAVGDRVLVETTEVCRAPLRGSDILGRIGGEEFAIVLPHTDSEAALNVAEGIRAALEKRPITEGVPAISASFGVAALDSRAVQLDELLRRADAALYEAKNRGRNVCAVWKASLSDTTNIRRVFKAGQIIFNTGRSVIDCTVRGLSENAASLDVVSTADIPDTFKLGITADGIFRTCNIIAKHKRRLEVAFA